MGKRIVAVVAAFGLVLMALTISSGGASAAAAKPAPSPYDLTLATYAKQKLDWRPCYPGEHINYFKCALMTAPMNWANPAAGDIQVLVSRTHATNGGDANPIMFGNFGGPGQESALFPYYQDRNEPTTSAKYDLVGMDPRGVGGSTNLDCADPSALVELYSLDGRDESPANVGRFRDLSKTWERDCADDPYTKYITTDQTVRDMDLLRATLHRATFSYIGYSAGTWLGSWYASVFPQHVSRFLLDGNTDFTEPLRITSYNQQPAAFQSSWEHDLVPWLAASDSVLHLGATPEAVLATYEARRAALVAHPLTLADGSQLTAAGYDYGVSAPLYWIGYYPDFGPAMAAIEHYDTATPDEQDAVASWFGPIPFGPSDNVFWTLSCQDTPTESVAQATQDWQELKAYPLLGATWLANPCPYWHKALTGTSAINGGAIPPVLMLQNDRDPATPFVGALDAHDHTPASRMVTVLDEPDHTIYGTGDACVDDIANAWLLDGVLPAHDVTCDGLPLPPPLTADAAARSSVPASAHPNARAWARDFVREHGPIPLHA